MNLRQLIESVGYCYHFYVGPKGFHSAADTVVCIKSVIRFLSQSLSTPPLRPWRYLWTTHKWHCNFHPCGTLFNVNSLPVSIERSKVGVGVFFSRYLLEWFESHLSCLCMPNQYLQYRKETQWYSDNPLYVKLELYNKTFKWFYFFNIKNRRNIYKGYIIILMWSYGHVIKIKNSVQRKLLDQVA